MPMSDPMSGTTSQHDNRGLTLTTGGCHHSRMNERRGPQSQAELISKLKDVRAAAVEHTRIARELARERRQLIEALLVEGLSQADIARELGVTRQAIQKMVEVSAEQSRR
jgi:DNA-directed RNA polymerase specialized sigma24 family protein